MSHLALLFPGQGAQAVGMGRELIASSSAARHTFAEADEALGFSLSRVILEGPADELKRTAVTQPAIVTTSVAAYRALQERGAFATTTPAFAAGHSLGEYAALVAAGAVAFAAAVKAVRARGTFMQEAVPEGQGAMAAVLGMDAATIRAVVGETSSDDAYVACANFNGPEQTVIAGTTKGVEAASAALKAKGARRVLPLPVSAPFHCRLMAPVQPRLDDVLAGVAFRAPAFPVVTNVEATPNADAARIRPLLVEQVTAPVRFTEIAAFLVSAGVTTFVEVGPGKTLVGIVKRAPGLPDGAKLLNVEDDKSLAATLAALA
ncbi:MAG: ACP S-malonyltransferase [Deltaproteobacteria bacterium]|nr:ACP S-malonyltransferase [Deltaproteobacteria bacterium]